MTKTSTDYEQIIAAIEADGKEFAAKNDYCKEAYDEHLGSLLDQLIQISESELLPEEIKKLADQTEQTILRLGAFASKGFDLLHCLPSDLGIESIALGNRSEFEAEQSQQVDFYLSLVEIKAEAETKSKAEEFDRKAFFRAMENVELQFQELEGEKVRRRALEAMERLEAYTAKFPDDSELCEVDQPGKA